MATEVEIYPATLEDARELAPLMRPEEADEVRASIGMEPLEALEWALSVSSEAWAGRIGGRLAGIWGVAPLSWTAMGGRRGSVWLLTTHEVERHAKTFWRACRRELGALFSRWDVLTNSIDLRHEKALRWGRRLGFNLGEPAPFGKEGRPFVAFDVREEDLACAPRR